MQPDSRSTVSLRATDPRTGSAKAEVSLVVYHRDGGTLVGLHPDRPVVVGREVGADLVIPDDSLSRRHARFLLVDGQVVVEDLASTNGTRVNGSAVPRAAIGPHDEIRLGAVTVAVHLPGRAPVEGLWSHDRCIELIEAEVQRAQLFDRPFSLLMMRARGHLSRWWPTVRDVFRVVDQPALYGPSILEVLLPETGESGALELARAAADVVPHLKVSVVTFPGSGRSTQELLQVARAGLSQAVAGAGPGLRAVAASEATSDPGDAVFSSPPMQALLRMVDKVARSTITVLVEGETGSGKEVVAQAIHDRGPRTEQSLVVLNCGAIPSQLVESTLFGHEKGSFTGADERRAGVFEQADGGTLFLDEVGELPLPAQAALLRVLETGKVTRVGGARSVEVDVRLIAATHRSLTDAVEVGRFRADLLFRLNTITLAVPPLRDRPGDIAALVQHFISRSREAQPLKQVEPDALALLEAWHWPGNVRELRNVIDRATVIADDQTLTVQDLPEPMRSAARAPVTPPASSELEPGVDFKTRVQRFETELILAGLAAAGGNQSKASELLGIPRRTLVHKMQVYAIRRGGYGQEA